MPTPARDRTRPTQRWTPEELLRALVEVEIHARDASNTRLRGKQASFPTSKTIEQFDLPASSITPQTWAYLTSLEWTAASENNTFIGPAGTGKSHALIALGHAAVATVPAVRYSTAAELVENLYRGLADNSVGKLIETALRNDLVICDEVGFAPLDSTGSQLLFCVTAAYEGRSLAIASHWPFEEGAASCPSPAPPSPARPPAAPQQRRRHRRRELPHAGGPQPVRRAPLEPLTHHASGDSRWPPAWDRQVAIDKRWIGQQRLLHALNYCLLLSGPKAQQLAIYVGWLLNGLRGGLVAGVLLGLVSGPAGAVGDLRRLQGHHRRPGSAGLCAAAPPVRAPGGGTDEAGVVQTRYFAFGGASLPTALSSWAWMCRPFSLACVYASPDQVSKTHVATPQRWTRRCALPPALQPREDDQEHQQEHCDHQRHASHRPRVHGVLHLCC